jgi:hypothetical protein
MTEISPIELLMQLRAMVVLLSLSSTEQMQWLEIQRVSADEMYLQLDDAIPSWFARLDKAGLINELVKDRLSNLLHTLIAMKSDTELWGLDSLDAPEWEQVRIVARSALSTIDELTARSNSHADRR